MMTRNQYPGYPMNVYNDLSIGLKKNKGGKCVWMDQIGLCPCCILNKKILNLSLALLLQGSQYRKRLNILRKK